MVPNGSEPDSFKMKTASTLGVRTASYGTNANFLVWRRNLEMGTHPGAVRRSLRWFVVMRGDAAIWLFVVCCGIFLEKTCLVFCFYC